MDPLAKEKKNTVHWSKWEKNIKPLIEKYASAVEVKSKSIFDDDQSQSTKIIFKIPFLSEFELKNIMICCECEISRLFVVKLDCIFDLIISKISCELGQNNQCMLSSDWSQWMHCFVLIILG